MIDRKVVSPRLKETVASPGWKHIRLIVCCVILAALAALVAAVVGTFPSWLWQGW